MVFEIWIKALMINAVIVGTVLEFLILDKIVKRYKDSKQEKVK